MARISSKGARAGAGIVGKNERKPHEERWPEIIDAAAEIFWEKGYHSTSMQDIADRVGILKGSLYYYIASKTDLRAEVLSEVHHSGISKMRQLVSSEDDPLQRLYNMCHSHVLHVCANLARTAVFLREIRRVSAEEKARIGVNDLAYANLFQEAIGAAQAQGFIRLDVNVELAGLCTLSGLNSVYTWFRYQSNFQPDQVAAHLASSTLRGLATPEGIDVLENKILKSV